MKPKDYKPFIIVIGIALLFALAAAAEKDTEKAGESERKVTEAEVPKAALKALTRQAKKAEITEFSEEIEHGSTFYEGSWKAKDGTQIDCLVTKDGALVEIEEQVTAKQVPGVVVKAAKKAAGKNAEISYEKKTMILYEVKFAKDGASHEVLLTPDGRVTEEETEKGKGEDEGDGDGDGNGNSDGKHDMKASVDDDDDDDDDDDAEDDDDDNDDDDDDDDDDEHGK